jgi:hypothetical protein
MNASLNQPHCFTPFFFLVVFWHFCVSRPASTTSVVFWSTSDSSTCENIADEAESKLRPDDTVIAKNTTATTTSGNETLGIFIQGKNDNDVPLCDRVSVAMQSSVAPSRQLISLLYMSIF